MNTYITKVFLRRVGTLLMDDDLVLCCWSRRRFLGPFQLFFPLGLCVGQNRRYSLSSNSERESGCVSSTSPCNHTDDSLSIQQIDWTSAGSRPSILIYDHSGIRIIDGIASYRPYGGDGVRCLQRESSKEDSGSVLRPLCRDSRYFETDCLLIGEVYGSPAYCDIRPEIDFTDPSIELKPLNILLRITLPTTHWKSNGGLHASLSGEASISEITWLAVMNTPF